MENNRLLLIVNPHSGKAKMRNELLNVTEIFSSGGFEVTVYPTKSRGDATLRAERVKQDEYSRIVVCGGDGTLNEVITGLMHTGVRCIMGYIPSGTLNEWSSGLRISKNIRQAAKDIVTGRQIDLDVGKFADKFFSYTASFGAFTEVSYSAPQDMKNVLGQAAYFFEGVKSLGNIKPIHLKIEYEDRTIEDDFLFGAVSNSMSVGGVVKFNEAAVKLNDGLFEVMLIHNPDNVLKFQSIIDGILRQDLNREGIEFFHTSKITFSGAPDLSWTLDGEYAPGNDKVVISNIPSAIDFIVPIDASNNNVITEKSSAAAE